MQFGWVGSAEPVGGKFGSVRPWVRSSRWCWSGAGGYHGSTSLLNQGGWSGVEWSGKADKDRGSDDEQVGRG